ncbi:MAG: hypothetical protein ACI9O1_000320 [Candidatus Thalassarchaeaceae archaeon]|jgi:hypothetical protein
MIFSQLDELKNLEEMKFYHGKDWNIAITILSTWVSIGAQVYLCNIDFQTVH